MNTVTDKPLTDKRRALGRGLAALLPPKVEAPSHAPPAAATMAPIEAIAPNPLQPRTVFQPERLEELAASIRAHGIIQPLIVRQIGANYQIVAGERRLRAAHMAGLKEVPVVVQDVADQQMLELALIENIQREDLNPIETAHAYDRLSREMGLSQEEIGRQTGKDRASIAHALRLLKLPQEVQVLLAEHQLSMGHAKAILGLASPDDQIQLAEKTAAQGLSVRQVEALVQKHVSAQDGAAGGGRQREQPEADPNVRAAVDELERALGTRVRIVESSAERGRIEITYYSQAELDRLFKQLVRG
ncbi:MAG TPA: ParB/RepB/Spo0J family partition protein [Bryobacteraceae bacterium]